MDIGHTLVAKSDQLNADDLVGGDIIVRITGVNAGDGEQPVVVAISGGHKPWKPCKTMRRVLAHGWGTDASAWVGKGLKLYRDADVKWAGSAIGGIRVRAMTDIPKAIILQLAETKGGKKLPHRVEVLTMPTERRETSPIDTLRAGITAAGFPVEGVVAWLGADGCDASALNAAEVGMVLKDITGRRRGELEAYLAGRSK
jgi:hypothetical protein